jgi:hypothetical protein
VLGIIDVSAVLRTRWYKRGYSEQANRTSTIVLKSAVSESRVLVKFGGAMATVAEVLLETLILSDVKRVYGLPGDSLNGFTNSIGKHKQTEWIARFD